MTSIQPPAETIWWKQPLDRVEGTWITIALVWSLIMFIMMPCGTFTENRTFLLRPTARLPKRLWPRLRP